MILFDRNFCDSLEYRLCDLFKSHDDIEVKKFWCDGVIYETMSDDDTACFTAFAGKSGQEKYRLYLQLGDKLQAPDMEKVTIVRVDMQIKRIWLRG